MVFEPIAIIGYGCYYPPDALTPESFWDNIISGKEGIRKVSSDVWDQELYYSANEKKEDKTYCLKSGYIDSFHFPDYLLKSFNIMHIDSVNA
ncbi:MAG TPA: hypothetical protein GXX18_05520 [Bacillales bacterium]|nr:hypothetical protein [Bacillales bacterium]